MKRTYLKVNFHINQKVKPHRIWRRGGPSRMIKFVRGNPFSEKRSRFLDWLDDDTELWAATPSNDYMMQRSG
jgi:hypothetical protein